MHRHHLTRAVIVGAAVALIAVGWWRANAAFSGESSQVSEQPGDEQPARVFMYAEGDEGPLTAP